MWEAEPHHSVCHPVSLNSGSCLLTVILICTQRGARLGAVFVSPPQSPARGRLRTSDFSARSPRNICFWFSNSADVSLLFFLLLLHLLLSFFPPSPATPNPGTVELLGVPKKEKSGQQNHITQAEAQTPDRTLKHRAWLCEAFTTIALWNWWSH